MGGKEHELRSRIQGTTVDVPTSHAGRPRGADAVPATASTAVFLGGARWCATAALPAPPRTWCRRTPAMSSAMPIAARATRREAHGREHEVGAYGVPCLAHR
jgi:hypothetical protein